MISVKQALKLIQDHRRPMPRETVALRDAPGRICAEDIIAQLTTPPFNASAMDGYAVRFRDVRKAGSILTVIGEAPAGAPFDGQVGTGEAVRIFTGGVLPDGADHIVIQENATRTGDQITTLEDFETPRHIRRAGIDFNQGDCLITAGTILSPAHIALAAASNNPMVMVLRKPKIAFVSSGDELREPGETIAPGQIINSNRYGLAALVESWGAEVVYAGRAQDSLKSIQAEIERAKAADIIVPIGGASVGDYDFMKPGFSGNGFDIIFEKIAVKPGKPTWLGASPDQMVLGLPGNPASAWVCANLFLKPLLFDGGHNPSLRAALSTPMNANGPRESYMRGRLSLSSDGAVVEVFPRQDSSLMTPLASANVLVQFPPDAGPWAQGDPVTIIPLYDDLGRLAAPA